MSNLQDRSPGEICQVGLREHQLGHFDAAELLYRRAIAAEPHYANAWHLLGLLAHQMGRQQEAVQCVAQAVQLQPAQAEMHNNLGVVLQAAEQWNEALAAYQEAIQLQPNFADAWNNRGYLLQQLKRYVEAEQAYREAIRLQPDFPEPYNNMGRLIQVQQGDIATAIGFLQQALQLRPNYANAYFNLGFAFQSQGNHGDAESCFRTGLKLQPKNAEMLNALGDVLEAQEKNAAAENAYREAIRIQPEYAIAENNLGALYHAQGRFGEALQQFESALRHQPEFTIAKWNRGLLHLLHGNLTTGWPGYECRWEAEPNEDWPNYSQPLWLGEHIPQETLLLHAEQGLGDTLQFIRYAQVVRPRCGRLIVACPPSLIPILQTCAGIDSPVAHGEPLPPFDFFAPLLSLPRILNTDLQSIPAAIPYLAAQPSLVNLWRERLLNVRGLRIGINWRGKPGAGPWRKRDVPLDYWSKLAEIPGVRLVSLQRGPLTDDERVVIAKPGMVDFSSELDQSAGAFMDTAAIMKNLDLVISSDTSVPHLAGALGVPVWTLLPLIPDWRWMLQRSDSPWYPTMRLFRQGALADWNSVMQQIVQTVREHLKRHPPASRSS